MGPAGPTRQPAIVELASCTVDLAREVVHASDGSRCPLTTREAALLAYLAARPGVDVSRDTLLREVWGYARHVQSRATDTTMRRLREKVEVDPANPRHLLTVFGHGYRFEPLTVPAPAPEPEPGPWWTLDLDGIRVDLAQHLVRGPAGTTRLTTAEGRLLSYLAARPGTVVSRRELERNALPGGGQSTRVVDSAVHRLRRKIEHDPGKPRFLEAVRGKGYVLRLPAARFEVEPLSEEALGSKARGAPVAPPRPTTNIGPEPDAFVGRTSELAWLQERFLVPGLVTLTGIGGGGKTRLARRASRSYVGATGQQAWFCDLSEARGLDTMLGAVARALGVPPDTDAPRLVDRIGRAIATRGAPAVVLDNLEQLLDCVHLVDRWREAAPSARFLVTSRQPLDLAGEQVLDVGPLDASDAVGLLVTRAADRGVEVAGDPSLPELAARVDRLPLALELAAGQLGERSPADVLARLSVATLRARGTGRPGRHRTMRATLDWSWVLLSGTERAALSQLSLFRGGFTFDAAQAVVRVPDGPQVGDLLQALVRRSWIRRRQGRYTILGSVLAYLAGKGAEDLEAPARHGAWFAGLAAGDRLGRVDLEHGSARRALEAEVDNLEVACRRAVARDDAAVAVATCRAAWAVLALHGPFGVGVDLAERVLAMPGLSSRDRAEIGRTAALAMSASGQPDEALLRYHTALTAARDAGDPHLEARVLEGLGGVHFLRGEYDDAATHLQSALVRFRLVGDASLEAACIGSLGDVFLQQGRMADAQACLETSIARLRAIGNRRLTGMFLANLGNVHRSRGEVERARACYEAALVLHRETGNETAEANLLGNLGNLHATQSRAAEAIVHFEAAVALHARHGNRRVQGNVLGNIGTLYHELGRLAESRAFTVRSLSIHREVGNRLFEANALGTLGNVELAEGRLDEAERCYEQALALHRELGAAVWEGIDLGYLGRLALCRGALERACDLLEQAVAALATRHARANAVFQATLAEARHAMNDDRAAAEAFAASERMMREAGWRTDLAECLTARARCFAATDPSAAAADLAEAEAIANEVGSPPGSLLRIEIERARRSQA